MIDKAIAKITDEMMNLNDPLTQMIEEHLTGICINNKVAGKILQENKNLAELKNQLWREAGKRKSGNGAYIPNSEIYEMAEAYFGITEEDKAGSSSRKAASAKVTPVIDISQFL